MARRAAVLFLLAACLAVGQSSSQAVLRAAAPAVYAVLAYDGSGSTLATGSAVALEPAALVTNRHLVAGAVSVRVERGGRYWAARVGSCDRTRDLCRLEVAGLHSTTASLRRTAPARTGEPVYAVSAPTGRGALISQGVVSGMRPVQGEMVIQTSAAIPPGGTGGGLFDQTGKLLGITATGPPGQDLNLAAPVEAIEAVMASRKPAAAIAGTGPDSPPLALRQIHSVCIGALGATTVAKEAQAMLLTALVRGGRLRVLEDCDRADGHILGAVQDGEAGSSRGARPAGDTLALEVRLVDPAGNVIWADAEESNGSLTADAAEDAAGRVAERLAAALGGAS